MRSRGSGFTGLIRALGHGTVKTKRRTAGPGHWRITHHWLAGCGGWQGEARLAWAVGPVGRSGPPFWRSVRPVAGWPGERCYRGPRRLRLVVRRGILAFFGSQGVPVKGEWTPIPGRRAPVPHENTPGEGEWASMAPNNTPVDREWAPIPVKNTPVLGRRTPIPHKYTPVPLGYTPIPGRGTGFSGVLTLSDGQKTTIQGCQTPKALSHAANRPRSTPPPLPPAPALGWPAQGRRGRPCITLPSPRPVFSCTGQRRTTWAEASATLALGMRNS